MYFAIRFLRVRLIERTTVLGADLATLTGDTKTGKETLFYFIKLARVQDTKTGKVVLTGDAKDIHESVKGSGGKLFSVADLRPSVPSAFANGTFGSYVVTTPGWRTTESRRVT